MALGCILLCLTPSIQQQASTSTLAEVAWDALETLYGTPTIPNGLQGFQTSDLDLLQS